MTHLHIKQYLKLKENLKPLGSMVTDVELWVAFEGYH